MDRARYEETKGFAFVAKPNTVGEYQAERLELTGYIAGYLTGINDAGAFCGTGFKTESSYRVLLRGEDLGEPPSSVPFAPDYEPFPTGITNDGVIFGQATAVEVRKDCAGHGSVSGTMCVCDDDYELDPYDALSCLAVGAACSGHGHEHEPGECHCDAGFKNPIGNPSECVPS